MSEKQERAAALLDLADDAYFGFGGERQTGLQSDLSQIGGGGGFGEPADPSPLLAIGGPRTVDIDERASVPILVGSVQSGMRAWQVNPRSNLHVFARNVASGEIRDAQALRDMRRGGPERASGKGDPPDEINAGSIRSSVQPIDLKAKLPGFLGAGLYTVTAVAHDVVSNSIEVKLESDLPAEPMDLAARVAEPQPGVTHRLDDRQSLETRIELPAEASRQGAIPLSVAMQVRKRSGVFEGGDGAYWPCNAVALALDQRPVVVPAWVPVKRIVLAEDRLRFNADFDLDLGPALRGAPTGDYQVYLDTGEDLVGPFPLRLGE